MVQGLFGKKEIAKNSQNQITLPADFREIFSTEETSGRFYVYMEEERSLLLSTLDELVSELKKAKKLGEEVQERNFLTVFYKNIEMVKMGSDGRLTLTKEMMEKAGIQKGDKKLICCGTFNKVEIWSVKRFNEQIEKREIEFRSEKRKFENEVFKGFPGDDLKSSSDEQND